ncbi:MAG: hypothetical protein HYT87_09685 [Nitrospirae bacterium]|nr:hypothetical protein [Nitrospirota bacterium]
MNEMKKLVFKPVWSAVVASVMTTLLVHTLFLATTTARAEKEHSPDAPIARAQLYVVKDEQGKNRAFFGLLPDGSVGMRIMDKEGVLRTQFTVSQKGSAGLVLTHKNAKSVASFFIADDGQPGFTMTDAKGESLIVSQPASSAQRPGAAASPGTELPSSLWNFGSRVSPEEAERERDRRRRKDECLRTCQGFKDTEIQKSCLTQCQ